MAFAVALDHALPTLIGSPGFVPSAAAAWPDVCRIGCADDQFFHGLAAQLLGLCPALNTVLAGIVYEVQPAKCHVRWPAMDDPAVTNMYFELLAVPMPRDHHGGMTLLGTTAAGWRAIVVGAPAAHTR